MFIYKSYKLKNAQRLKKSVNYSFTDNKIRKLTYVYLNKSGRTLSGWITVRHRGHKIKSKFLKIDNHRLPNANKFLLLKITKQSIKLPFAGLIKTIKGKLSYIILSQGIYPGWFGFNSEWTTFKRFRPLIGFMSFLINFKQGDSFFNYVNNNKRCTWARSAGTYVKILYLCENKEFFAVMLPSGKIMTLPVTARAVLGRNSNILHKWIKYGGAGYMRILGWRPTVRGVAMNPVDHPHGGRTKTSQPELSPWGWVAKKGY